MLTRTVHNGCFIVLTALSTTPKKAVIECKSNLQTIRLNVEGFDLKQRQGSEEELSMRNADVCTPNNVEAQEERREAKQIREIGVNTDSKYFVSEQTIDKWELRAEKYNEVYGEYIQ